MCNLGKACGTCHANFRRLLTSQLANEVSGWSGKYIQKLSIAFTVSLILLKHTCHPSIHQIQS